MKRTLLLVVAMTVVAGLIATSCASSPNSSGNRIPREMLQARRQTLAMEGDYIVGIGVANLATMSQSRAQAANRATMEIVRQLELLVEYMSLDMSMNSEVDRQAALSLQLDIQRTLARQNVRGATVIDEYESNGDVWIAMRFSRNDAKREIASAVQAASRLAAPLAVADWAEGKMDSALDNAFGKANALPPQFRDND